MNQKPEKWKFDDIKIGFRTKPVTFQFSEEDVKTFSKLSGDYNPLHRDDTYAKDKGFEGVVVHGILLASKFSYLVGMVLPGKESIYISQQLLFHNPVYIDEELSISGCVESKSKATKIIEIKIEIHKKDGKLAVSGLAQVRTS